MKSWCKNEKNTRESVPRIILEAHEGHVTDDFSVNELVLALLVAAYKNVTLYV
jgi:hypothetical protein